MNDVTSSYKTMLPLIPISIFLNLWTLVLCYGFSLKCLKLPTPPLHGRLIYKSGKLAARLKCNDQEDISLSTREEGILTCDPAITKSIENFRQVEKPVCLPYKAPSSLQFRMLFSFILNFCDPNLEIWLTGAVKTTLDKLIPENCSSKYSCFVERSISGCSKNYNPEGQGRMQLDIEFSLNTMSFEENAMSVDELMVDLKRIMLPVRQQFIDEENRRVKPQEDWMAGRNISGKDSGLSFFQVYWNTKEGWQAKCNLHNGTIGTFLGKHHAASCRGCKKNYYLDETDPSCRRCPLLKYTEHPFATKCNMCPYNLRVGNGQPNIENVCRQQ